MMDSVAETTGAEVLAQLDPAPLDMIRAIGDGSDALLAQVIDLFVESGAPLVQQVRAGLRANDTALVRTAAHTLKSSSANLGGTRLAEICLKLEVAARTGNLSGALPTADDVEAEYKAVCKALSALVRKS
ncbi:MAG TPA: Hpt domain-containing protein [Burkholderiales bacterium]|nr:Hpt domain-containing protein [Burkholderiales bacterium]